MKRKITVFILCLLAINVSAERYVIIDKAGFCLSVVEDKDTLFQCPVALGKNYGNKERFGDMKTPEGTFTVCSIEKSSHWTHDFKDGKGVRKGAYGPYFFRLKMPRFRSIGIHGTCKPETIGTRDSEGCVRLYNEDLQKLREMVFVGMKVLVTEDAE